MPPGAGLYIQSHVALRDHIKTRRLASRLGVSLAEAIGHLHLLWWATIEYATDGDISAWTAEDVAFYADWGQYALEEPSTDAAGFLDALIACGWVDRRRSGLAMHDWKQYAHGLIEARGRAEVEREAGARGNHIRWHEARNVVDPECAFCRPASGARSGARSGATSGQASGANRKRSVVKRSVEKKNPSPTNEPRAFDRFWAPYPRKVGKRKAEAEFARAVKRASVDVIVAAAERFRDDPNLPETRYIPHPTTWLAQDRWEDEPLPSRNGHDPADLPAEFRKPDPGVKP